MRISDSTDRKVFTMNGTTMIHGQEISYTSISEETFLEINSGTPAASMFSFTYLRTDIADAKSRPVLFIYNGGPGSSSHLMHLGFFGPDRVKLNENGAFPTAPPFEAECNPHCMLDAFDLVLIDPVDTGYGQLLDPTAKEHFFGVEQDAASFVLFIENWLTRYDRWDSPRFICGESYGTTRSAVLANALMGGVAQQRFSCITVNGIIMMGSTYHMEGFYEELPVEHSVLKLMTYAASNLYHHPIQGKTLSDFVEEAYDFSMGDYATALLMGDYLSSKKRNAIIKKLSYFTGIQERYFQENGLRLDSRSFLQNFIKDQGLEAGGYDSRVTLPLSDQLGPRDAFDDPSMASSNPAYASLFLSHFKKKLGITLERSYTVTNVTANIEWDYKASRTPCQCLAASMRRNPQMRILFASGLYDLCTCAGYARYVISQMGLPLDRVVRKEYEGGHMIYTREHASAALEQDIRAFIAECI